MRVCAAGRTAAESLHPGLVDLADNLECIVAHCGIERLETATAGLMAHKGYRLQDAHESERERLCGLRRPQSNPGSEISQSPGVPGRLTG